MKSICILLVLSFLVRISAASGTKNVIAVWPKKAIVHFAANDAAILYLNGKPKSYVTSWSAHRRVVFNVNKGDVIAFKATNRKDEYGFIANIRVGTKNFPTGSKYWRATHGGVQSGDWMRKSKGFCWHRPMLVPAKLFRSCTAFPRRFKARYVWACRSSPGIRTMSLLRFVVGGDGCGRKPVDDIHFPTVTPSPSPSTKTTYIDGAGDEDSRTTCKCDLVANENGMCYYFLNPLATSGPCMSRLCAQSYQCKENGSILCIKKYVLEKIVPLSGTANCIIAKTRVPVWVPYAQQ
ncbi:unnamed protein product [Agarophyton chilense]|eukprot:gb/GEZJ01001063.1/.p1 GENE.gb/GEZJ01001063.1/~~gb/GEZJ01001063.1/.p1  ORF type:complete len:302 (-),score=30.46 gb/GEZJ01001063.1/:174-1052(-)